MGTQPVANEKLFEGLSDTTGIVPADPEKLRPGKIERSGEREPVPPPLAGQPSSYWPASKDEISYWGEFINGFKGGSADALYVLSNATGIVENAAAKLSGETGKPLVDAVRDVRQWLRTASREIQPGPEAFSHPKRMADTIASTIARVAGSAIPTALLYGGATAATRSPAAGVALVDALREMEKGPWEMGVAAIRGAIFGKAMDLASSAPLWRTRTLLGGSLGGFHAFIAGRSREDVLTEAIASGLFTGGLGLRRSAKVSDLEAAEPHISKRSGKTEDLMPPPVSKRTYTTKDGGIVEEPPKGVLWPFSYLGSPEFVFRRFPKTFEAVRWAKDLENKMRAELHRDSEIATRSFKRLPRAERLKVIEALDSPEFTILDLPSNLSAKGKEAFVNIRTLLEKHRQDIIRVKRELGLKVGEDWGIMEGYWPHEFRGTWVILANGKPIPTGFLKQTRRQAIREMHNWLREHPKDRVKVVRFGSLPKRVQSRVAKERFSKFLQKREAMLPGWTTDETALQNYLRSVIRYKYISRMEPRFAAAREELVNLFGEGAGEVRLWDRYADAVRGRPGYVVEMINRWAQEAGKYIGLDYPNAAQMALGFIQSLEAVLKLGISPVRPMINMFQTMATTLPILGKRYTEKGVRGYVSGKYDWLLERLNIRDQAGKADYEHMLDHLRIYRPDLPRSVGEVPRALMDTVIWGWNGTVGVALYKFQKSEIANRSVAAIGAYIRARDKGLSYQDAIRKAQDVIDRAHFHFGPADTPILLSNQFTRTLFQFKTFMLKMTEFMLGLTKPGKMPGRFDSNWKELSRFLGVGLAAVGVAAVPGIETLNYIFKKTTGQDLLTDVITEHPELSRGALGTALQVETRTLGYGDWPIDPDWVGLTRLTGPIVSDLYNLVRIIDAEPGKEKRVAVRRFWRSASPTARTLYDAYQGQIKTLRGRIVEDDLELSERIMTAIGFKTLKEAHKRKKIEKESARQRRIESMYRDFLDRAVEAAEQGDLEQLDRVLREAFEHGFIIDRRSFRGSQRKKMTPLLDDLNRRYRRQVLEPESIPPEYR